MSMMNRQLLGEEEREEGTDSDRINSALNTASEESQEEQGGQIVAFESKVLDFINKQHYHGLVGCLFFVYIFSSYLYAQ